MQVTNQFHGPVASTQKNIPSKGMVKCERCQEVKNDVYFEGRKGGVPQNKNPLQFQVRNLEDFNLSIVLHPNILSSG
jgi:hypothetical protein